MIKEHHRTLSALNTLDIMTPLYIVCNNVIRTPKFPITLELSCL